MAGDVFDLFVGNREWFKTHYAEFLRAVEDLNARGVDIHYIEGNHDFQLKGVYDRCLRFHLHADSFTLEQSGRRFFVAHGDLVDQRDRGYLLLRTFFRSPFMAAFLGVAPDAWISGIARSLSRKSQAKNPRQPLQLPEAKRDRLRNLFRSFARGKFDQGYDFILLGHCHDIDDELFQQGSRTGHYMNIGYPRVDPRFVMWTPGEDRLRRVDYLTEK